MPGEFTGLQLICYMYVGFKIIDPTMNSGIDLSREYNTAKQLTTALVSMSGQIDLYPPGQACFSRTFSLPDRNIRKLVCMSPDNPLPSLDSKAYPIL
ncbi:MAG: hypothetical protein A2W22_01770 [Candidatus Levybacteria bacterium RBG_16_35_11]|nr:MAG: hypothetical protein A2W22_01770 [Candidatus Levybacteria bacterium RBG_16_35_11]